MEGDEPPPPPPQLISNANDLPPQLFSFPSTSSLQAPPPYSLLSPLLPPTMQSSAQLGPEIDWVGLLSGCMDQTTQAQVVLSENGNKSKGKLVQNGKKKNFPPRIEFHTRSSEDILDDGFKWRKYGQKSVKNSAHPRSYYRCTHHTCNVKKQIQRLSKDRSIVVTTYEGIHNHPCEKLMETLSPLLKQLHFLPRF
ncbi:PREDICTED: probable WRKY transcription factor 43 [Ipomoea nil]|uniref:probable WRKY transcription factor 43 n=1 Tax=Ipomoea nil TaxID=35883 RepID=UPI000900D318|nr:PREDICTED: probable WRKY transcription factor 43 [Ipomoea nil]